MHDLLNTEFVGDCRVPVNADVQLGFLQDEGRNNSMGSSPDAAEHLRLSGEEAYARRAR